MSTTQQQDAPKCTAADGLAEIFNVPGHPLLVRAVDFNRLHAKTETLRADVEHKDKYAEQLGRELAAADAEARSLREGYEAARLEIE